MSTEVIHNTDQNRYEIWLDGEKIGHADYSQMPGQMHLVHTEVDPAHQGKQYASILMQGLVDDVRATGGIKLVPVCPYTVAWLQRHTEQHDLLDVNIDEVAAACGLPKRSN